MALIASTTAGAEAAAAPRAGPPKSLDFARTFATVAEPTTLHARIRYRSGNAVHHLEVWRVGEQLIRRDTDNVLTSIANRTPGDANFHMLMLDHKRRIATTVDRNNLYRVGNFAEWFDLGHGLRLPKVGYRLTAIGAPAGTPPTPTPCDWVMLTSQHLTTRICWCVAQRLPLLILGGNGKPVWRVDSFDHAAVGAKRFAPDIRDYVRADASRDIAGD